MHKKSHNLLIGISVLPALLVMPTFGAVLDSVDSAMEIAADATYDVGAITIDSLALGEESTTWGLIDNNGVLNFNGTTLSNNIGYWGVVDNMGTMTGNNLVVTDNNAYVGGFVYNENGANITNSTFSGNSADISAGAIWNGGNANISGSTFDSNTALNGDGGAIANGSHMTVENSTFSLNSANGSGNQSGAIINYLFNKQNGETVDDVVLNINNSTFTGNYAPDVGAISNFSTATIQDSTFTKNHSDLDAEHEGDGGGALFVGSESITSVSGTTFTENTSGTVGGAIATRSTGKEVDGLSSGNNTTALLDISGGTFTSNIAGTKGGAFYNGLHGSNTHSGYVTLSDSTFASNSAVDGGAIYNASAGSTDSVGGKIYASNVSFNNNTASGMGGAVYNNVEFILSGTNTFTGNTAADGANDIYNVGALTVVDGTTTIDGGIAGTGTLTIANGATLNIGSTTLTQGAVELNGTIIAALNDANDFAKFNVGAFSGTGNMNLALKSAGEYKVFDDAVFTNDNVTVESSVYDIVWNDGKDTITATLKSVEDIAKDNDLSTDAAQTVANLAETTSEKLNDLGMRVQEHLASGNADAAQDVNDAINPETTSVVQAMTTSVQNTIANVAAGRMALPTIGRNGGDMNVTARGVWAQGLYNRSKYNDRFSGDTYGVAAGFDTTINHDVTIGAGYAYNNSDIDATLRNTDIDSHTIFVYGQYKPAEWYVNGTLNYTMSKYSESGNVLGTPVDSDYDVDSFGAQVMTGYDFASGITPEFGLRYMHITTDDYTNSLGIKNHMDDNDFLTAVLGTKYTFDIRATRELMLRPELRYAVKCDIVSDKLVSTVAMPGIAAYTLDAERMSRIGNEFGVGLNMLYRGLDMSVSYEIDIREDYTSQTGMLKFRYNF